MTKYSIAEIDAALRDQGYVLEADQMLADVDPDAQIILTAPHGEGEARTIADIGIKPLEVRVHGGDLLRDCYRVTTIDGLEANQ